MPALAPLPELVLGVLWLDGPCTAYHVRRAFQDSLSSHLSGSAGAIYPAIARLREQRLIAARAVATDARGAEALSLTPRGKAALSRWVGTPLAPDETVDLDHLRLRLRFLALLPPARRRDLVDAARSAVREKTREVAAAARAAHAADDLMLYFTHRSVQLALRARAKWLDEVQSRLGDRAWRLPPNSR